MNRRFSIEPLSAAGSCLAGRWRAEAESGNASPFLSWEWVSAIHQTSGHAQKLYILWDEGRPLALLGRRHVLRHGVLRVRQWHLNETGDAAADRVALEYNGLLQPAVTERALGWLMRNGPPADELVVRNATSTTATAVARAAAGAGWASRTAKSTAAPWLDLVTLRQAGGDLERRLGANTRSSLRRARKLYTQAFGPLHLSRAADLSSALQFFDRLEALHTAHWQARGESGAFADPRFRPFHRAFLEEAYGRNMADLLRISAGGQEIGYLYNLRTPERRVMAYQSGVAPVPDNRWKPGYLCHAMAATFCATRGDAAYDFLAGPVRYKQQLADRETPMHSIIAFAPRPGIVIENALRRTKMGTLARMNEWVEAFRQCPTR